MQENYSDEFQNVIAVTNRHLSRLPFRQQIKRICSFAPRAIVLREKDLGHVSYLNLAAQAEKICAAAGVALILHSDIDAALQLGIPRIHLPLPVLEDTDPEKLAGFEQIGSSVHSVDQALRAQQLHADYLTAGHIYATDCKKGLQPRGLEFLRDVCGAVDLPVYAIGGIHIGTGQVAEVMHAGAAGACIMSGMMQI